jgi:peptidylprolyl isomerase
MELGMSMEKAQEGDIVRVHIAGRLLDGREFEMSREPQDVIIGHGDLIPEIEQALIGMTPGENRTVILPKGKGFASRREDLVQVISRDVFPRGIDPKVGLRIRIPSVGYEVIEATIIEVSDSEITLDGNHPLAGEDVLFVLNLLEIVHF